MYSKDPNVLPIVQRFLDDNPNVDIAGVYPSPGPNVVVHEGTVVGQVLPSGEIEWFDTPKTAEAQRIAYGG